MKRFLPILLLLAGCGSPAVVTVNGQAITKDQLDARLEGITQAASPALQGLVQNALIDQWAQSHHVTIPQSQIDKEENKYKARAGAQWAAELKANGLTEADVQNLIRRQAIIDKAVGSNVRVTEKQIADYFNKNRKAFDQPPSARARHIVVADLATAQKVEADLKAGKDFAAEAKQYSQDASNRDTGGELGWFNKGARMEPAVDQYVFSAPIGAISPPIKSFFGYQIVQVEERKPAVKASVASAHDQIAQMLRSQQEYPLIGPFLQQLQQSAKIQVNDPRFAALFPTPLPFTPAPAPAATPTK